jgi:anti-sigma regulatory factor (Ser/Thr protein kinase)
VPLLVDARPGGVTVELSGRLTGHLSTGMLEAVRTAVADYPRSVLVDICGVTGLTPAGVGALFVLADLARDWPESPLVVVADAPLVTRLADVRVADRLVVRPSVAAAYAAVGRRALVIVDRLRLPSSDQAPRIARHFVLDKLPTDASGQLRQAAALVVTELVSNAVIHGGTSIEVRMTRRARQVRLSVLDSRPIDAFSVPEVITRDAEHVRGLVMVRALSLRFGALPTVSGGKMVWSLLDDEPPPITAGADGMPV